jgi:ubiquinone/menaquinone biosynthesis C-methylase UbiE
MSSVEDLFEGPYESEYAAIVGNAENTAKEAEFIVRELKLTEADRVLDLACGHGRHALLVAQKVCELVGYDRTERFIEQAQKSAAERKVTNARFIVGDMRELAFESEFDAAYNYFTAWGFYDDQTNFDILKRVHRALKPSGRFLLEFIHRDCLMRRFLAKDWTVLADGTLVLYERKFDFAAGRQHSVNTYRKGSEVKKIEIDLQMPTANEFMRLFRQAGFTETRLVSAPDGGKVGVDTRRIAVIGTK